MDKEIQELVRESILHPNTADTIIGYLILIAVFILLIYGVKICILFLHSPLEEGRKELLRRKKEQKA